MRNPLLTDGITTKPLSEWRKQYHGYAIEKNDTQYIIQNCHFTIIATLTNINKVPQKQYYREYRARQRFKLQQGLKINELAKIKFTTRQTIYNNLEKLDLIPNSSPLQIKLNSKIFNI